MKKQEKIQAFLFIVGVFLILITYFYYPYKNKSLVEKNIQEDVPPVSDNLGDKSTSFESLEYKGLYDLDKTFLVKSEKECQSNWYRLAISEKNLETMRRPYLGKFVKFKYDRQNFKLYL